MVCNLSLGVKPDQVAQVLGAEARHSGRAHVHQVLLEPLHVREPGR